LVGCSLQLWHLRPTQKTFFWETEVLDVAIFFLQDMAEKMINDKEKIKSRMSTNEFVVVRTVLDISSCLVCIAEMQGSLLI
jgi:hypothetical protein